MNYLEQYFLTQGDIEAPASGIRLLALTELRELRAQLDRLRNENAELRDELEVGVVVPRSEIERLAKMRVGISHVTYFPGSQGEFVQCGLVDAIDAITRLALKAAEPEEEKTAPCRCGEDKTVYAWTGDATARVRMVCPDCGISGPWRPTKALANESWNLLMLPLMGLDALYAEQGAPQLERCYRDNCGGAVKIVESRADLVPRYYAECTRCYRSSGYALSPYEASAAWNLMARRVATMNFFAKDKNQ